MGTYKTQDTITIMVPTFTLNGDDGDKLWCTFLWMVGQNWGFTPTQFYWGDFKRVKELDHGSEAHASAHQFTQKYSKWISIGYSGDHTLFAEFNSLDWEFTPWVCEKPRSQRIWVHLYNAVWKGVELRDDLIFGGDDTTPPSYIATGILTHLDWFKKKTLRQANRKCAPHYLLKARIRNKKIVDDVVPKIIHIDDTNQTA